MNYKVYGLLDEFGDVFYVGCTGQKVRKRLMCHISKAKLYYGNNIDKNKIIRRVLKCRELRYKVFETLDNIDDARELEKSYISKFSGVSNHSNNPNYITPLEVREHYGRVWTDDEKTRVSLSMIGTKNACGNTNVRDRIWINNGKKNKMVYQKDMWMFYGWEKGIQKGD